MLLSHGCQADQRGDLCSPASFCKELASDTLFLDINHLIQFRSLLHVASRKLGWDSASASGKLLSDQRHTDSLRPNSLQKRAMAHPDGQYPSSL
ncbi:MAG: hypothetical protein KDI88_12350 [Gammaproteobacteria bacterium]|nr:hypothetical protein [Gammaproteobacteria bacterium]